MTLRLSHFAVLVVLCVAWLMCGCGPERLPEKPSALDADIRFSDDGNKVVIVNKNRDAWHKLYVTFIDDHRYRFYYIDKDLTLRPGQSIAIPLKAFKDEEGNPMNRTKEDFWRFRIEDSRRVWRLQKATNFPTG